MDDADRSQDRIEAYEAALIRQAATAKRELEETGMCHNCQSSVPEGLRFCDKDCSTDWQVRKQAAIRRGLHDR